ncbi:hypothetical protein [Knoellia sp. LjRoot47]|uniref:hypothetical protein n=1 Tax=Knoellia sp. LjRoot47 TaxID=3342330 RepID=UPI003ECCEA8F
MRTSTSTRRAAALLATMALTGLVTVAPAHAEAGPGDDGVITSAEVRVWENEHSAPRDGSGSVTTPLLPPVDDNAIEYLQVALGAIGGLVVAGAIAAGAGRRHGDAHPA